jgi:hypothetical protein
MIEFWILRQTLREMSAWMRLKPSGASARTLRMHCRNKVPDKHNSEERWLCLLQVFLKPKAVISTFRLLPC